MSNLIYCIPVLVQLLWIVHVANCGHNTLSNPVFSQLSSENLHRFDQALKKCTGQCKVDSSCLGIEIYVDPPLAQVTNHSDNLEFICKLGFEKVESMQGELIYKGIPVTKLPKVATEDHKLAKRETSESGESRELTWRKSIDDVGVTEGRSKKQMESADNQTDLNASAPATVPLSEGTQPVSPPLVGTNSASKLNETSSVNVTTNAMPDTDLNTSAAASATISLSENEGTQPVSTPLEGTNFTSKLNETSSTNVTINPKPDTNDTEGISINQSVATATITSMGDNIPSKSDNETAGFLDQLFTSGDKIPTMNNTANTTSVFSNSNVAATNTNESDIKMEIIESVPTFANKENLTVAVANGTQIGEHASVATNDSSTTAPLENKTEENSTTIPLVFEKPDQVELTNSTKNSTIEDMNSTVAPKLTAASLENKNIVVLPATNGWDEMIQKNLTTVSKDGALPNVATSTIISSNPTMTEEKIQAVPVLHGACSSVDEDVFKTNIQTATFAYYKEEPVELLFSSKSSCVAVLKYVLIFCCRIVLSKWFFF